MAYDVLALVTDRAAEDVEFARELWKIPWQDMTTEQKSQWLTTLKGAYNASDLNRVEEAVEALANLLRELPAVLRDYAHNKDVAWQDAFDVEYDPSQYNPSVKTDWSMKDIPSQQDMNRYLENVQLVRTAFPGDYPSLPASMDYLSYSGANAIEETLAIVDAAIKEEEIKKKKMIDNAAEIWIFAGQVESGVIWTQIGG